MAASVRIVCVLLAGCAAVPTTLPSSSGDAPEVSSMKARFPEFYEKAHARLAAEFHGRELAARAQLGPGRWRSVVQIDVELSGDVHGCKLLRSSGFNGLDEEALAACKRVKQFLFPPEGAIDADQLAHVPVQLVVEID